jgi:hypothetical protein
VSLTQDTLRDHAARQIRVSRPELARRADTSTTAGLLEAHREVVSAEEPGATAVSCVVRRFDLVSLIRASCAFAAGLDADRVSAWRRSFTRTIFLAGNPRNLAGRFDFAHIGEDGVTAWTHPSTVDETATLRRLLKLFEGPRELPPWPAVRIPVPGPVTRPARPVRRNLYLATAGVSAADGLVHLNHLLAEAVFDGLIRAGDELVLRQVPRLTGVTEPFEALRVGVDQSSPIRLRAYAGLSTGDTS